MVTTLLARIVRNVLSIHCNNHNGDTPPYLYRSGLMAKREKRKYTKYNITMSELVLCGFLFAGIMGGLCVVVFAIVSTLSGKVT